MVHGKVEKKKIRAIKNEDEGWRKTEREEMKGFIVKPVL